MIRNALSRTPESREDILNLYQLPEQLRTNARGKALRGEGEVRLPGAAKNSDDAAIVEISSGYHFEQLPNIRDLLYKQYAKKRAASKPSIATAPQKISEPEPNSFNRGQPITGTWNNGVLTTSEGKTGRFFAMNGKSHIGFEFDGFRGFLTSQSKGIAFNKTTNEMYRFEVDIENSQFSFNSIRSLSKRAFIEPVDRKASWEAEMKNGSGESQGMRVFMNPDGTLLATIGATAEQPVKGQGYYDKLGNLAIAFDNNVTVKARYSDNQGKLKIFDYEYL